jgi:signal-transduction protein with cAMP-binding, CBS, and nucleotidyltransferase domain
MMQSSNRLIDVNFFADAIDSHPQIVTEDVLLTDIVKLMTEKQSQTKQYVTQISIAKADRPPKSISSCVLVVRKGKLTGIFTERDVVKLTVKGIDFGVTTVGEVMSSPVIAIDEQALQEDICAALFLFRRYQIRHLAAIDRYGQILGTVSPDSIRQVMRPTNLLKLRRVSEVMTTQVIHAPVNSSVMNLAELMSAHRVSCIVIANTIEGGDDNLTRIDPVGIVTERDLVRMRSQGVNLTETIAGEVMSHPLFLLDPDDSLWTAHDQMQRRRVQRLVVSWDWGTKIGILTQTNLLRIFDSIEHNSVVEAVMQEVSVLTCARVTNSLNRENRLQTLLTEIQLNLQHLLNIQDLSSERQQFYLGLAIADLQKIGDLFDLSV